tara:strand:- start:1285 stop:3948 length:2664 start_codon:yes stop_codon:yes gene_type:complete
MALAIAVYYKAHDDTVWDDVTENVSELPSWDMTLNSELMEFTLSLTQPVDSGDVLLLPESGDDICICLDNSRTQVLADSLAGVIIDAPTELIGYDEDTSAWYMKYNLRVVQRDCTSDIVEHEYKTATALNTILTAILKLNTDGNDGAGEGFLGGSLNSVAIPKYVNEAANINVNSFDFKGPAIEALTTVLKSVGYYWKAIYYVEPDSTNTLNLVQQIVVFDINGLAPDGASVWGTGLTDDILKSGFVANPAYISAAETPDQRANIYAEEGVEVRSQLDSVKNYIDLNCYIQDGTTLSEFTMYADGKTDTFDLGSNARDIVYVNKNKLEGRVQTFTSTTIFTIDAVIADQITEDASHLATDSLACKIVSSGTSYYRTFTNSTTTITLGSAVGTLAVGDEFHYIHSLDLFKSGKDDDRADFGAIKYVKPDENARIKFQKYNVPDSGDTISCHYYALKQQNIPRIYRDNIKRYGLRYLKEEIKQPLTLSQLEQVYQSFDKRTIPLQTVSFTSYRPDIIQVGWHIPVDITNVVDNQQFLVNSVSCEYIASGGQSNKPTIKQQVKLSSYRDDLTDILNSFKSNYALSTQKLEVQTVNSYNAKIEILAKLTSVVTSQPAFLDKIAFVSDRDGGSLELYIANPDMTAPLKLTSHSSDCSNPRISRDGTRIAYAVSSEIYIYSFITSTTTQWTNVGGGANGSPDWSLNDEKLVFDTTRSGTVKLVTLLATEIESASNVIFDLSNAETGAAYPRYNKAGDKIIYTDFGPYSIWTIDPDNTNNTLIDNSNTPSQADYFHDDSGIVYARDSGGSTSEIVKRIPATAAGTRTQLINDSIFDLQPVMDFTDTKVYFQRKPATKYKIFTLNIDGTNLVQVSDDSSTNDQNIHYGRIDTRYL